MSRLYNILIIDDNPRDFQSFRQLYDGRDLEIKLIGSSEQGLTQAALKDWSAILVDLDLGKGYDQGLKEVLPTLKKKVNGKIPVLVITNDNRERTKDIALQLGAQDFLQKGKVNDQQILERIKKNIEKAKTGISQKDLGGRRTDESNFIVSSNQMQELQARWQKLAHYPDAAVLLLGETGVGKDVAARIIYEARGKNNLPFVAVNLKAFSEELRRSELLGYVKGAFTGADKDKIGFFELAGKGTLFIDEIGEIDESTQIQLLRVLENRVFQKVGDTKDLKLEAQLIFATNKNPEEEIESGNLREDFYQRIKAITFTIPPLRERTEEIIPLITHFLEKFCPYPQHPLYGKNATQAFTPLALERLHNFHWPGNIRELSNEVQRLVFEADFRNLDQIDERLLAGRFENAVFISESNVSNAVSSSSKSMLSWSTDKVAAYEELKRIEQALIQEGGRKFEAACRLGLKNDQTLRYRVEKKYYAKYPDLFEEFQVIKKAYNLGNQ